MSLRGFFTGHRDLVLLLLGVVSVATAAGPLDEPMWIRRNVGEEAIPQNSDGKLFPTHPGDAFKGMDSHVSSVYGYEFSPDEIKGRNTWVMWSGGNQAFWDYLARNGNGVLDFLRLLDSRFVRRSDRFPIMGIIPSPGMTERNADISNVPPKSEWTKFPYYGLSLDSGIEGDSAFAEGPAPDPLVYGYPSGIVGLWLYPREKDPDPRVRKEWEDNKQKWDPVRYIKDENYYKDPNLIRPYRVGMSCAFCHISVNPMNPPEDMSKPEWSNLSGNIGSQYFWFGRVFGADLKRNNLIYYLTSYAEPGSLDTSLVATDGNNNPNTMNGVFQVLPRLIASFQSPMETQSPDTLKYMPRLDEPYDVDGDGKFDGPNDVKALAFTTEEQKHLEYLGLPATGLPPFGQGNMRTTPKVLAGGADSIGARGALCRVYLNIGEYSEMWNTLHNPMVGIAKQKPFRMKDSFENSINWSVTMRRSTDVAKYFLSGTVPMRLENAPGGKAHVKPNDDPQVKRGAEVFAKNCFVCHSSLNQPEGFWKEPANWKKWIQTPDYVEERAKWLTDLLSKPVAGSRPQDDPFFEEFVKTNYLSTDARYHVTEIGTNSGRSLADNAGSNDRMWADYSSAEFKAQQRRNDTIKISHPYKDEQIDWALNDSAGPGNYRPHSLSSMWAHGPYLHNNSVGYYPYEWGDDPRYGMQRNGKRELLSWFAPGVQTVDSRVKIFEDGTRRLLGLPSEPSKEAREYRGFSEAPRRGFASIQRTDESAGIVLAKSVVGDAVEMQTEALLGFGIPYWVLVALLIGAILLGLYLIRKGVHRFLETQHIGIRSLAAIVLGLVIAIAGWRVLKKQQVSIGHVPAGTPLNLIANINGPGWATSTPERKRLLKKVIVGLIKADLRKAKSLDEVDGLVENLIALSKCPDLVLDRGHQFGWYDTLELSKGNQVETSVEDREALIEFLKKL